MTDKLKILFITRDFSNHIEKSSLYLINELCKQVELKVWHNRGHISRILDHINFEPDFILLNDYKPDYCPLIKGLKHCDIPVGIIMHDLHYKISQRKKFIENENIQHIFSIYRDPFLKWYPEFKDKLVWFPFHVPIHVFKDYKNEKIYNLLMMGAMDQRYYPLRKKIFDKLKDEKGFQYYQHPGYGAVDKGDGVILTGAAYAKEINRSKIFLTCDSILHFPLLKYFEVLACNTLLLAPSSQELEDLGFVDGETFVAINETNFKEKAYYYLENEQERNKISTQGYKMINNKHSTKIRVMQMIQYIIQVTNNR